MKKYIYKGMLHWRKVTPDQRVVLTGAIYRVYDQRYTEYYEAYWEGDEARVAMNYLESCIRNNSEKEAEGENL